MKNQSLFKLGEWLFDPQRNVLRRGDEQHIIEPLMVAALICFIEHQENTLTRQELMQFIWQGRYVSDNTINKLIAKLRTVLGDNVQQPRYIETVAKQGYRLICSVEHQSKSRFLSGNKRYLFITAITFIVIFCWYYVDFLSAPKNQIVTIPIHSDKLLSPKYSNDGQLLTYVSKEHDEPYYVLNVRELSSGLRLQVKVADFNYRLPTWSSNDRELYYLKFNHSECFIEKMRISMIASPQHGLQSYPCNQQSISDFVVDNSLMYIAEYNDQLGSHIIVFNQENKQQELLIKSALGSEIMWLTLDGENQQLAYIELLRNGENILKVFDLTTRNELFSYSLPVDVLGLSWRDTDELLITANHQLLSFSIGDNTLKSEYQALSHIHSPTYNEVAKQVTMVATRQQDLIEEVSLNNNTENTAVIDELSFAQSAKYGNQKNHFVYLSNQNGSYQLWYRDELNNVRQLTDIENGLINVEFEWSNDDSKILLHYRNNLVVINMADGFIQHLVPMKEPIFSVAWFNNSHFLVSTAQGIWRYAITGDERQLLLPNLTAKRMIKQKNKLYYTDLSTNKLLCIDLISNEVSNISAQVSAFDNSWIIKNEILYYLSHDDNHNYIISQFDMQTTDIKTVYQYNTDQVAQFSIIDDKALITTRRARKTNLITLSMD